MVHRVIWRCQAILARSGYENLIERWSGLEYTSQVSSPLCSPQVAGPRVEAIFQLTGATANEQIELAPE